MSQSSPMEPFNKEGNFVADYRQKPREFLVKCRRYLAGGDLHQASGKGWDVAWMAKTLAEAQGWQYRKHDELLP